MGRIVKIILAYYFNLKLVFLLIKTLTQIYGFIEYAESQLRVFAQEKLVQLISFKNSTLWCTNIFTFEI